MLIFEIIGIQLNLFLEISYPIINNELLQVVDCAKHVMKHHCYWPLVSDLHNVLCHPPIAFRFMADNSLLTMWFDFIRMFQGILLIDPFPWTELFI